VSDPERREDENHERVHRNFGQRNREKGDREPRMLYFWYDAQIIALSIGGTALYGETAPYASLIIGFPGGVNV
jgi:hypothetical protein